MLAPADRRSIFANLDRARMGTPVVTIAPIPFRCACPHCGGAGWIIDVDAALIATIAAATKDRVFTAAELAHHARVVGGPLRAALEGKGPRKIGKVLQRIAGRVVDGAHIERIGDSNGGALWRAYRE